MKSIAAVFALSTVIGLSSAVVAAETKVIDWGALMPSVEPYDNPFADLDQSDIRSLAKLLWLENQLETKSDDDQLQAEARELRDGLTERGMDVDALFAQRQVVIERRTQAATLPNTDIVGETVRLPGYILPLEMRNEDVVEFLLVPTVGACIHTPPPAANQVVQVSYPQGIRVNGMYAPIWITGQMQSEYTSQDLNLVDGVTNVAITYQMTADNVEPY